MLRYLAFPEEQKEQNNGGLKDYNLVDSKLLPNNFGNIAAVNIFLGENNSGKSRFMREIMRNSQTFTISIWDDIYFIKSKISNCTNAYNLAKKSVDFEADIKVTGTSINVSNPAIKEILDLLWRKTNFNYSVEDTRFSPREIIDNLRVTLTSLFKEVTDLGAVAKLFSFERANQYIEEIKKHKKELLYVRRFLKAMYRNEILGRHYHADYHDAGFRFSFAKMKLDIFPWDKTQNLNINNVLDEYVEGAITTVDKVVDSLTDLCEILKERLDSKISVGHRTYIPTLRTARTLITQEGGRLESTNDIFLHTTIHDYGLKETGVVVDTGFGLYDAIDTTRNARHEGRTSFKDFERFLSATFFNGKDVEVVAERVRDQRGGNIIVAVEGVERDIHHLGDGIQAIIMLLYPLFIAPEKAWFFIEEPEVHLHPGFQRLFIETITSNPILQAKQLTIFLTTHSNHLLDFALDDPSHVSIFTFRRREGTGNKSTYQIQLSSQRDIENLNALGVQNTSVFLANCSIWVEGISDRLYFRAYLHAYLAELATRQSKTVSLLEGLHYTFLEYAGGNVTHFDFTAQDGRFTPQTIEDIKALSISNRILLVADRDAGKDTRHQSTESKQHNAFKYEILPVREVENLLSPALLAKGLKKLYSSRDFDPAQLIQADYRISYIGKYLQDQYGSFPASFTADSGTIKNKRKLAEVIIPGLTWSEMSPAAQKFTKTLYDFIIAHNPRLGSN